MMDSCLTLKLVWLEIGWEDVLNSGSYIYSIQLYTQLRIQLIYIIWKNFDEIARFLAVFPHNSST